MLFAFTTFRESTVITTLSAPSTNGYELSRYESILLKENATNRHSMDRSSLFGVLCAAYREARNVIMSKMVLLAHVLGYVGEISSPQLALTEYKQQWFQTR